MLVLKLKMVLVSFDNVFADQLPWGVLGRNEREINCSFTKKIFLIFDP